MLIVDTNKCGSCGACVVVCGTGAAQMADGKAYIDLNLCVECYACKSVCPNGVIIEKDS